MRLISWNVAGRVKDCDKQIEALISRKPDIVALQEVRKSTVSKLREGLSNIGLEYAQDSIELAIKHNRPYGELIACRWSIKRLSGIEKTIPFPERVLSVMVFSPGGEIEFHTAHIPPGASNGWIKIETFEGIYKHLACHSELPRILCGDFNSPQAEKPDGRVVTWGEREKKNGEILVKRGQERWDSGERSVIEGLSEFDLSDIYRQLNGYSVQEYSWFMKRKEKLVNRRFDHIFASGKLNAVKCSYIKGVYETGLSDHAAIEADFELGF
jgi:exonuclease III